MVKKKFFWPASMSVNLNKCLHSEYRCVRASACVFVLFEGQVPLMFFIFLNKVVNV